jgi:hypothetical protein
VSVDDLGLHQFDNGALDRGSRPGGPAINDEHNGLISRVAAASSTPHLRDWADWTLALGAHIARTLETGTTIVLSDEGGQPRVVVAPVDPALIAAHGRRHRRTAGAVDRLPASLWHEIATWFGWSACRCSRGGIGLLARGSLFESARIRIAGTLVWLRRREARRRTTNTCT